MCCWDVVLLLLLCDVFEEQFEMVVSVGYVEIVSRLLPIFG